jgi:type IV pilus assembly protein PilC
MSAIPYNTASSSGSASSNISATLNSQAPAPTAITAADQICFLFDGTDALGRDVNFYIWASHETFALTALESAKITVTNIRPRSNPLQRQKRKVSRDDLANFALQLAERTRASEQIRQAIGDIARSSNNKALREALFQIHSELKTEGVQPAEAFRKHPQVFPDAFVHILHVGIKKGDPSDMLTEYGETQLRTSQNIQQMKGALYYPAVVLSLAAIVVAVLCIFILPRMEEMYQSLLEASHGQLPAMTQALLGFSRFLVTIPGAITVGILFAILISLIKWSHSPNGRDIVARKALRLPLVGKLLRDFNAAYTVHLLSILAPVVTPNDFLREAAAASLNPVYRENLETIREAFRTGGLELQTAFAPYAFLFGDEFQPAIATGEKTGQLDIQLSRYATFLDNRVQESISRISKLVEPLTLLVAGIVIGLIVISAYLPLFTLIGQMSHNK